MCEECQLIGRWETAKLVFLGNNSSSVDSGLDSVRLSLWSNKVCDRELFNIVHSGPCTEIHSWNSRCSSGE